MSREFKIKIIGTGIFILLLLSVVYLVFHSNRIKENPVIEKIKLSGNNLLNENEYLSFTRLNNLENYKGLTLQIIKSRFEKHPYIKNAEIKLINEKEVIVYLTEKKIYGVIIQNNKALFAAEDFQILPVFPDTKLIDIPVLSNVSESYKFEPLKKIINDDMLQAYKIIDASDLADTKMLKAVSEINLRNGGDVILSYSGINIPVIFGRNNEAGKIVTLETLMNNYLTKDPESDYIDLRFYNDIYIGHLQKTEL